MPNGMRWVGLDVHAHASTLAVFDDVTGEVVTRRVNGRPVEVLDVLRELRPPMRVVYEAGPTGYGLVRRARAEGIEMAVCSPGNIERRPGDRIKTDKRDAIRLARLFAPVTCGRCGCPAKSSSSCATWCAAARTCAPI